MQQKILFLVGLLVIFGLGLLVFRRHLLYWHKGRLIDTIVAMLILVAWIATIVAFAMIFDSVCHIF